MHTWAADLKRSRLEMTPESGHGNKNKLPTNGKQNKISAKYLKQGVGHISELGVAECFRELYVHNFNCLTERLS